MIEIVVFTLPFNGCSEHLPTCVGSSSRHVRGGLKFFLFAFSGLLVIRPNLSSLNQLGFVTQV